MIYRRSYIFSWCETNEILSLLVLEKTCWTQRRSGASQHMTKTDYFNMRIYYFNRMRIYSTVQLCSITSLWHSGQHLCRAVGRLQVRISLGFWLLSKRRSLWSWLLWKKNLAGLQCTLTSSCAKNSAKSCHNVFWCTTKVPECLLYFWKYPRKSEKLDNVRRQLFSEFPKTAFFREFLNVLSHKLSVLGPYSDRKDSNQTESRFLVTFRRFLSCEELSVCSE